MKLKALAAVLSCASAVCLLTACSAGTQTNTPAQSNQDSITVDSGVDINAADNTPTVPLKTREGSCGDVNEDGEFTLTDVYTLNQYLSNPEKYPLSEKALDNADVHDRGNGVDQDDYDTLLKFDAGEITHLPDTTQN